MQPSSRLDVGDIAARGTTGKVFGGFLGYNVQWDQLIVGGELNYN